ncbi:aldehyde dehydrogenase [Sporichthya sp.]|uniref:aldehyde dehydrogenase n=1 Tax=Sporichthya sp. TaxID=65475 RepID=UPI001826B0E2|nr:aldehyde dehydrogenase [Sporichthya sp.]MBA3743089.1 aldehyde dehydrogenase [Sporichthya sp.]
MSLTDDVQVHLKGANSFYIGGEWVTPSSDATFEVIDSGTERAIFKVAEAQAADMNHAMEAAHQAFEKGPWPRMSHAERAGHILAFADALQSKAEAYASIWPRESGVLHGIAQSMAPQIPDLFRYYASLANSFPFEEVVPAMPSPIWGESYGLLRREPVGVVAAIVPWNGPLDLAAVKMAPAFIAGCTVILKMSPEAPAAGYLLAEAADECGLPAGVFNVVTANREVSEMLVRDPRVDKIAFTGSTAAGRRIASIAGERIARVTLELGGKSAAIILDDADLNHAAQVLAGAETFLSGQVCASLTRIVVARSKQDEFAEALAAAFSAVKVGDPFDPATQMGPLTSAIQRDRVEGYIAKGLEEGARLVTGGGRPKDLDRGYFIEPTVFANVDNKQVIAQEEIFGPVLSVIPADSEEEAIEIANDTIYGLNAAVFTPDSTRAYGVAKQLRSGTVGHNNMKLDFSIAFGGFKQSGIGREGGKEGLRSYLETKTVLLDGKP